MVNLVISEALHGRRPDDDEGVLSARRAAIVSTSGLARLARRIRLGDYLRLGEGEAQRGGRTRPILLASALEAVSAALFLDQGWEAARAWLCTLAAPELAADAPLGLLKSPKSRLQELTQRSSGERPDYRLAKCLGSRPREAIRRGGGGRRPDRGDGHRRLPAQCRDSRCRRRAQDPRRRAARHPVAGRSDAPDPFGSSGARRPVSAPEPIE